MYTYRAFSTGGYVYRAYGATGALVYAGLTRTPLWRINHRNCTEWGHSAATLTLEWFEDYATAREAEAWAIATESPRLNKGAAKRRAAERPHGVVSTNPTSWGTWLGGHVPTCEWVKTGDRKSVV